MEYKLKIESANQQQEVIEFLGDRIYEHNSTAINKYEGEVFTKIIRDKCDKVIAGITGWVWAGVSEITLLWVHEKYRKKALGKRLLKAAEDEIRERGCLTILLRTYSFQAPAFYEKNGYETLYILENFPNGHRHYTLVKRMTENTK